MSQISSCVDSVQREIMAFAYYDESLLLGLGYKLDGVQNISNIFCEQPVLSSTVPILV